MGWKVTAIVPAFNEELRVKDVLQVLGKSPHIDEVVCINDGSTDNTGSIVSNIKNITVITVRNNQGKASAIALGVSKAKGNILLFIDADLQGLTDDSLQVLLAPLLKEKYDAVVSYRASSGEKYLYKPLSGERAYFKKDLLPYLDVLRDKGYGLEMYLNWLFRDKNVKIVPLPHVFNIAKHHKQSYLVALEHNIREVRDIYREIFKQKNPISFFYHAYVENFYIKKPSP